LGIGKSLNEEDKSLEAGIDILFGSYQRIKPLIEKQSLYFSHLKWIVVDEIDTLFDTGKLMPIVDNILQKSIRNPNEKPL
jgi:superfamily II DNA/RNA helicase